MPDCLPRLNHRVVESIGGRWVLMGLEYLTPRFQSVTRISPNLKTWAPLEAEGSGGVVGRQLKRVALSHPTEFPTLVCSTLPVSPPSLPKGLCSVRATNVVWPKVSGTRICLSHAHYPWGTPWGQRSPVETPWVQRSCHPGQRQKSHNSRMPLQYLPMALNDTFRTWSFQRVKAVCRL